MSGSVIDVLGLLSVAYSGTKDQRTEATAQLEAALASPQAPQYLVTLVQAGLNLDFAPQASLSALLFVKNCLTHIVPDAVLAGSPGLLEELERLLFQGTFTAPEAHRRIICACTMTLISGFQWNYLPELMPMIVNESNALRARFATAGAAPAAADVAERSLAALEMLHTYTQRFKTPGLEQLDMKLEVSSVLVTALPVYLGFHDFRISRLVFEVMECVVETALQLSTEKQMPKNALDEWFTLMATFPEQYYQAAFAARGKAYEEYVKCVQRIGMITFSVINDATRRKKPAPVAAHFLKANTANRFLEVWRQWLQSCLASYRGGGDGAAAAAATAGDLSSVHRESEMYAMRFIKLCTLDEAMYKQQLRPHAIAIIEHLFFPYLCYGEEDEEIFNDDDNLSEYVQYMMDEGFANAELSQRQAASNAILAMIGGKKAFHQSAMLLQELLQVLTTGLSLETNEANFPRLFGFLQLLSILRKYLRQIPEVWAGQMAGVLVRYVAPRLHPDVPFVALRCKALVVCQRYCKVPMPSEEDFSSFIGMMCGLVQDKEDRIRLAAIDAICNILGMKRARPYLLPILVPLVEVSMTFLNRVHTTYVPTVILHLTNYFAPELTSIMGRLGGVLVQHFLATAFDLQNMEHDFTESEADISESERAAFSADALLDAIYTVVVSSEENKDAFLAMRPDMIRLIRAILVNPDSYEFMEKGLYIYLHVVAYSGNDITQDLWDVLPLLFQCIDSGIGVDFFNTIEEVLDNYVSGATVAFLTNPAIMEATLAACTKMLIGGTVCEPECRAAPAQLFEAMLHQAKGCAERPGLMDPYIPRVLGVLLQALVHPDVLATEEVRVRIWIIAAIMDCFNYNPQLTVDTMLQMGAYPQFFDGFFYFFRGCAPALDSAAAAATAATAAGGKGATAKKGKNCGPAAEAQQIVDDLSILTRKVIILGLSSLLSYLLSPAAAASEQVAQLREAFVTQGHEAKAVALVQCCIFTNEEKYVARCKVYADNLAGIRSGTAGDEDVEDQDMNHDEVLGLDGGDDTAGLANDDADDAYDDLSEDGEEWDDGDDVGGGHEEGDDYKSPIDDINEVQPFVEWLSTLAQLPAAIRQQATAVLRPESDFMAAGQVAAQYRAATKELDAAMEEDFRARAERVAH